jgi:hypothetical protein
MSNIFEKMVEKDPIKYPARMGKKWEDDEVVKLLRSIQKKKSISDIATEHQRTIGAINSERRKLAADYWFHDKRPIEEIIKFTGLTKEEIEDTIKRRTAARDFKPKQSITEDLVEIPSDMKEVIILLKDIQSKLSFLMEKVQ